ncbi:sodium:solute symporter family protein [Burkholderia sp. JSH-S8]|uniref:sodium:solute symporter family protein n=1 Tax=Burkholderia stagnalis TaxID=1503054 RepID=UPI000F80ACBA|nr:sodium:solute symporter family protein [Burkholderia stagnalis]WGS43307.1 sodium:solute symporter family protein [Burkholderia sp. JSH-S8]
MNALIGYGGVAVFFLVVIGILELTKKRSSSFSEYATAGRSFGPWFSAMAFLNTWLPGTMFISFAGFAAAAGVISFYSVIYSLLAVVLMFFLARPVYEWGKRHDLRTQADLLGLRYNSRAVRVIAALIGIGASFPWVILGMQSLALVFKYLSFGQVSGTTAVLVGIVVIGLRQIWTARFGMRGVIISDMVQGIVAYVVGTVIILGLLTWLFTNGHGFDKLPASRYTLPGPGSALGPLYVMSLTLTGVLGGWCWPDIFVRLFTSNGTATIKRSAVMAAPVLLIFSFALMLLGVVAASVPGVDKAPDNVWFITAGIGGVGLLTLAGICVVAATMGNIGANLQALGTQTANDIVGAAMDVRISDARIGRIAVVVLTILAMVGAFATIGVTSGLITLAFISYQAISQLAPTLLLGIFWKRGTAAAAVAGMVSGIASATVLQVFYPISIPWFGGATAGVVGLLINTVAYIVVTYALPMKAAERQRVERLFSRQAAQEAGDFVGQPNEIVATVSRSH